MASVICGEGNTDPLKEHGEEKVLVNVLGSQRNFAFTRKHM